MVLARGASRGPSSALLQPMAFPGMVRLERCPSEINPERGKAIDEETDPRRWFDWLRLRALTIWSLGGHTGLGRGGVAATNYVRIILHGGRLARTD